MATRKQKIAEDTAEDAFVEEGHKAVEWVEKHGRQILLGAAAVLVLTSGVLIAQRSSRRSASDVTAKLTQAVDDYREATDLQKAMTSTVPGALDADMEKALPAFDALIKEHGEAGAGVIARLYAGDLHRRLGQHEKAEALFKEYLDKTKADDPLRFLALEGAGYAAEEQGKTDVALGYFKQITELPSGFYKDYGLKHVARMHELKGDSAAALEAYKKIVSDVPDSKLREFADERIAALE
jgi:tetratricopeptide (TPR) repeat protein